MLPLLNFLEAGNCVYAGFFLGYEKQHVIRKRLVNLGNKDSIFIRASLQFIFTGVKFLNLFELGFSKKNTVAWKIEESKRKRFLGRRLRIFEGNF